MNDCLIVRRGKGVTGTNTNNMKNLCGTLSFTGTYATSLSARTNTWGCNDSSQVLIILQGANETGYENIRFNLASTVGSISLLSNYTSNFDTADPVGGMFGCILRDVDAPINVSIAVTTRNATYDFYQADLTVTYV